jgi:TIGR03009 family protein
VSVELQGFIRQLHCRALKAGGAESVSDAELLRRFLAGRDEAAFELLVWRHGILVLGTCRRILGPTAEVDDAFQATFLALLRQAGRIRRSESLPGWLHRVARRIAIRARTAGANRQHHERQAAMPEVQPPASAEWSDLGPILDQEIDRLPERFRLPFILCQLQGRSHEEAAQQLGLPKGTLLSRLARAKEKLRFRLSRRGVTLGIAALGAAGLSRSSVSAHLIGATMKTAFSGTEAAIAPAVATLTEGVLHTMFWNKFKIAACVLLTATTFASGGSAWACHRWHLFHRHDAASPQVCMCVEPPALPPVEPPALAKPAEEPKKAEQPKKTKPPEPPVQAPDADPKVRKLFNQFEIARDNIQQFVCKCSREEKIKGSGFAKVYEGEFRYLRPNQAALRMILKDSNANWELTVLNDNNLYQYRPGTKTLRIITVKQDEGFFWFGPLFGYQMPTFAVFSFWLDMSADEILQRFDIKLVKQDQNYVYFDIKPHLARDTREFARAQLVLFAANLFPCRLWIESTSGDENTWNIADIDTKVKLKPEHFIAPAAPAGWTTERVQIPKTSEPNAQPKR